MALPQFIFGGSTGVSSPQELQRLRMIADSLAAPRAPKNVGEGLSALGEALGYRFAAAKADKMEAGGQESAQSAIAKALGGAGSFPPAPGGGAAPAPSGGAPAAIPQAAQAHEGNPVNLSGNKQAFVEALMPAAIEESKRTGVDPRIIVAQAAQETGWGKSAPGNNYFGIKSHGAGGGQTFTTHEVINGKRVKINDSFRQFASPADSVRGYGEFLLKNPRYRPMMQAQGLDAQLQALGASGYATDPNYAQSVGAIARGLPMPAVAANEAMATGQPIQVASNDPSAGVAQALNGPPAEYAKNGTTQAQWAAMNRPGEDLAPNPIAAALQRPTPPAEIAPEDVAAIQARPRPADAVAYNGPGATIDPGYLQNRPPIDPMAQTRMRNSQGEQVVPGVTPGAPAAVTPAGQRVVQQMVNPQSMTGGAPMPMMGQPPQQSSAGPQAPVRGQVQPGNIDLGNRPVVKNADGTISTVRSMSFRNNKGQEVLIPTVADDGSRILSDQEAKEQYGRTGKHLGIFDNPEDATAYAKSLHESQANLYQPPQAAPAVPDNLPVMAGGNADAIQPGQLPSMQQLMEAAQNPWLNDQQRGLVNMLIKQQMDAQDPNNALDAEYKRAQIEALRTKETAKPAGIQEYEYAKQQGFPGTFQDWEASKKGGMSLQVDPTTGAVTFQQGNMKPMTEGQSKDTVFSTRAAGALPLIDQFGDALTSLPETMGGKVPVIGNFAKSKEFQQAEQAGKEFLQAILRKDTGAAITSEETAEYGTVYLPRPGDSPELLAQKKASRSRALEALKAGMPPQALLAQEKALAASGQAAPVQEAPKKRLKFNPATGELE